MHTQSALPETDYKTFFRGKKITLMGLGLLGRGVGDAAFLAECGAEVLVTDKKTTQELAESIQQLEKYASITYLLGEHRLEDFRHRDMIIKAAGVPLDSPYIREAEKAGIPVYMSTALFVQHTEATCVGITGTRGKTTVTMLIFEALKKAYETTDAHVYLGGNIRGVATLPLLATAKKGDIVVLELDSWQLQGFGDLGVSPHLSVFTTFLADHMNYYKNDTAAYFADKANIFCSQTADNVCVIGEQVASVMPQAYKNKIQAHTIIASEKNLPKDWSLRIPGQHNRYNAGIAYAALHEFGVSDAAIKQVFESFAAVSGRLEKIASAQGVDIYNDTNATTPDATVAALEAVSAAGSKNVVLIFGGADKGLDMDALFAHIPSYCKALVLLPGSGTDRIRDTVALLGVHTVYAHSMHEATVAAFGLVQPGDTLLMSPAFASFGIFKNEYDRGDQFVTAIKNCSV